jgi:hypothetical protein
VHEAAMYTQAEATKVMAATHMRKMQLTCARHNSHVQGATPTGPNLVDAYDLVRY